MEISCPYFYFSPFLLVLLIPCIVTLAFRVFPLQSKFTLPLNRLNKKALVPSLVILYFPPPIKA